MTDVSKPARIRVTPRRTVLRGAIVAGAAVPFLASCGSTEEAGQSADTTPAAPSSRGSSPSGGSAAVLASTDDVPSGGGLILPDDKVVITQPSDGQFRGFTSVCTHQGCDVTSVERGSINCPCHGSAFSIEDGSVVNGPATSPLPEKPIVVAGKEITLG
ncbi:MAG: Rieske (2Fe-2S) protein [Nocardioidaceae bacterium]